MDLIRRHFVSLLSVSLVAGLTGCGMQSEAGPAGESGTEGKEIVITPGSQGGTLLVRSPGGATLPDWAPSAQPTHPYSNKTFKIMKDANLVATGTLDTAVTLPRGDYRLVMNDTAKTVTVTAQQTTPGRHEPDRSV